MSFKIHLMVVSLIIGIVYIAWQVMYANSQQPIVVAAPALSPDGRAIQIIRASWGINCANAQFKPQDVAQSAANFATDHQSPPPTPENNVLEIVSKLCNGQPICEIQLTPEVLGPDPLPQCFDKQLEIEYRCFAFDRPWRVRTPHSPLQIDCSKKEG